MTTIENEAGLHENKNNNSDRNNSAVIPARSFVIPSNNLSLAHAKGSTLAFDISAKKTWLDAWYDPVAKLRVSSHMCISTADINGDGDYKLLVAGEDRKLKLFKNTNLLSEHLLLNTPCAIATFYSSNNQPVTATLAIASGCCVYVYKHMRPFYKFETPSLEISQIERELWLKLETSAITDIEAVEKLHKIRMDGLPLTERSQALLRMSIENRKDFLKQNFYDELTSKATITCMTVLHKSSEMPKAESMLVMGTEANDILILESSAQKLLQKIVIASTPCFIESNGLYDVSYRLVVACRSGRVHTVKNGKLLGSYIETSMPICGLVLTTKSIIIGCMNMTINSYNIKGMKQYNITMSHRITDMAKFELKRASNLEGYFVALASGEVRMYDGKNLLSSITCASAIVAMRFGQYGREDACLMMLSKTGSLTLKILQRQAQLEHVSSHTQTNTKQDIPLKIPKRTQLYVDQMQRERDQASEMHRVFQRDLCKLRVSAARSLVKIIMDGQGAVVKTGGSARINAVVCGVGPNFKLQFTLKNTGRLILTDLFVNVVFDETIYQIKTPFFVVPCLIPSVPYESDVSVQCIDENGGADTIRVLMCSQSSSVPIINAIITMPVSDVTA